MSVEDVGALGTWYALDRVTDVSGVSGTGRVAYALVLDADVIMLWDTTFVDPETGEEKHSRGVELLPSVALLTQIHCYEGKTALTPLNKAGHEDWDGVLRGEVLLRAAAPRLSAVCTELNDVVVTDPPMPTSRTVGFCDIDETVGEVLAAYAGGEPASTADTEGSQR